MTTKKTKPVLVLTTITLNQSELKLLTKLLKEVYYDYGYNDPDSGHSLRERKLFEQLKATIESKAAKQ